MARALISYLQYNCSPTIVADLYASWRPRLHQVISDNLGFLDRKEEPYFYHNDHLGSTKLVMDGYGHICNEIDYMPFGEIFHSDRSDFEEHKFTGKERDEETQYDYFGARYYWSAAKHWLSVDPLSDKYPGISPYAYCGWNPINYIDPDGRGVFPSAEALKLASVNIMNDPQYKSQGKTTFCNIGTQAINKMTGDYTLTGRANDMGVFLRNPQNATSLTQSEALEYANMGAVIFASYISDGSEPGHIAVVAPTDKLSYSAQRKESVVSVFNIGKINGEMTLSEAFGKRNVGMFILNKDLKTINTNFTIDGGSLGEIIVWGNNPNKNTNIGVKTEPINYNIVLNL